MLFHYTVFNEDYISIYTLWLVLLPFLYCVLAGLVAWRLSLPPLSSDPGFAPPVIPSAPASSSSFLAPHAPSGLCEVKVRCHVLT
jgi:hypothetical protein